MAARYCLASLSGCWVRVNKRQITATLAFFGFILTLNYAAPPLILFVLGHGGEEVRILSGETRVQFEPAIGVGFTPDCCIVFGYRPVFVNGGEQMMLYEAHPSRRAPVIAWTLHRFWRGEWCCPNYRDRNMRGSP